MDRKYSKKHSRNKMDDSDSDDDYTNEKLLGFESKYSKPLNFVTGNEKTLNPDDDEDPEMKRLNYLTSSDSDEDEEEERNPELENEYFAGDLREYQNQAKVGSWESHTKGIGSKLLQKMGYKAGRGLGKNLQGIAEPIQAVLRKGRSTIGAHGSEGKFVPRTQIPAKEVLKNDTTTGTPTKKEGRSWKKTGRGENFKSKYVYKTQDDIDEKSFKSKLALTNCKIVDMTGPELQVINSFHDLNKDKDKEKDASQNEHFSLQEIIHNLNVLTDMTESKLAMNSSSIKKLDYLNEVAEKDRVKLTEVIELEKNYISSMGSVIEKIENMVTSPQDYSLDQLQNTFVDLKNNHHEEYVEFNLDHLIPSIVGAAINENLKHWDPLLEPHKPLSRIKFWYEFMEVNLVDCVNLFDPYSSLIWSGIIPHIRKSILVWDSKDYSRIACLLSPWSPLLPEWILNNIIEQMILSRLLTTVRSWDPLTDIVPIHTWIHPWLDALHEKMNESIFPIIIEKLIQALASWTPEDLSAKAMIAPWKGVFDKADMDKLLIESIVPKLKVSLFRVPVMPYNQNLNEFNQFWQWRDLLPVDTVADLLEEYIFPKLMQTLILWLNKSQSQKEIIDWFAEWQSIFDDEVKKHPKVAHYLQSAMFLVSQGDSGSSSGNSFYLPPATTNESQNKNMFTANPASYSKMEGLNFKELLIEKLSHEGIPIRPLFGRTKDMNQIYEIGSVIGYIEKSVCFVSIDNGLSWFPKSVNDIITLAR